MPEFLRWAKDSLGETDFNARIQHALKVPADATTTTLQAIVASGCRKIITTNLDNGIETAFRKAGVPLAPEAIGRGHSASELSLFDSSIGHPVLLKVHGSLERPETWVLTSRDYDDAYVNPGRLAGFFQAKVHAPLFVGFSFSDEDLGQSLRVGRLQWKNRSFALIAHDQGQDVLERLRSFGVVPIVYYRFDQIPEIIDEIFVCQPLVIRIETRLGLKSMGLRAGAASIEIDPAVVDAMMADNDGLSVVKTLANALEFQPNSSFLDKQPRRHHSLKGRYIDQVKRMILARDVQNLGPTLQLLSQYYDIFFGGLLPSLYASARLNEPDLFWLITTTFEAIEGQVDATGFLNRLLLSELHSPKLGYHSLRAVAKVLAIRGTHPALQIPPLTVRVGRFRVPVYPLTESQVLALREGGPAGRRSVKPYVIKDLSDVAEILVALQDSTGENWRLPSVQEWLEVAELDGERRWPWGSVEPTYQVHAHLRYVHVKADAPQGPIEVGLFPQGQSPCGLMDLIGNVHELVFRDDCRSQAAALARGNLYSDYRLAGGSWTTKKNPAWSFQLVSGMGRPKMNTGIRPVVEVD
ncbi:MAG: SIR2 family protein [Thermoanaerobaculia bacterium]|nr:SIR2 family protein [Thermoanaerobaculia bacterium]